MGIPATPGTPITFEQINDDLSRPLTNTLDLETAGQLFGLDIDADDWSDGEIGLSMSEFRNAGAVATSAAITLTTPANYSFVGPTALFLQPQAVGNPVTNPAVTPSPGFITAGPHTLNFGVTANGTYVIYNALNTPPATVSPASGIDGAPPANNIHTITLPALPYSWDSPTTIPASPYSPFHNSSTMYNGFGIIQDRFPSPIATANSLAPFGIRRMYNDKYISSTVNPVPHVAGTYEVGWIDWRWGIQGEWTLGYSAAGNPLPDTDTSWVTEPGKGTGGTQPFTSNFYRQPITVKVTANPSPTQTRQTQIFAFLPTAFNPTPYGPQMNKNGNPVNPTTYYYPITVIQNANPASAPTMAITPSPISLDYSGTGVPVTLNVTPNTKTYSVSIVGPQAPNFSFTPNTSPKTNDATITVSATEHSGASPRGATLRTIIPAPNPVDIITTDAAITQTGISLSVGGYPAPGGMTDPIPYLGSSFTSRPIVTTAPSNAPWTVTKSPFITVPAITSGTGPSPFGYEVSANSTYSPRPGHVTVDFNVGGNPYQTVFTIDQEATPAEPEFAIPSPVNTTETFNATSNPTKSVLVETNVPFTVGFTGDTAYWSRVPTPTAPATQTNFTVPFGAPTTYTISYQSDDNNDYEIRSSTVTITSPVTSPTAPTGVYTKQFELSRNPSNAYLNFKWPTPGNPTVTGWSYTSTPAPQGGRLTMPGVGGAASLQIESHPNLNWSLFIEQPHPDIAVGTNFNGAPIGAAASQTNAPHPGNYTWNLPSIPAGPPTGNYSYKFTLADSMGDVVLDGTSTSRQVGMVIGTAIPEIIPTITISPTSISPTSGGETKSISATGNAPFTKSIPAPQAPWLSVSPTSAQTAGPATTFSVITTANPSTSPRPGSVSITSPAGNSTITVTQAGTPATPSSIFLAYNATSSTGLCSALQTTEIYTDNGNSFAEANYIYTDSNLSIQAESGWYSDGTVSRRWSRVKSAPVTSTFIDEVECIN